MKERRPLSPDGEAKLKKQLEDTHLSIRGHVTKCGKDLEMRHTNRSYKVTDRIEETTCDDCKAAWQRIADIVSGARAQS